MTDLKVLEEYLKPEWLTEEWLKQNNYHGLKFIKRYGGSWACLGGMLFSWRMFLNIDQTGYSSCIDYPDRASAEAALKAWDGLGDPPGPWLKWKGGDVDVEGPGLTGARLSE
jgi:hypothetical protein